MAFDPPPNHGGGGGGGSSSGGGHPSSGVGSGASGGGQGGHGGSPSGGGHPSSGVGGGHPSGGGGGGGHPSNGRPPPRRGRGTHSRDTSRAELAKARREAEKRKRAAERKAREAEKARREAQEAERKAREEAIRQRRERAQKGPDGEGAADEFGAGTGLRDALAPRMRDENEEFAPTERNEPKEREKSFTDQFRDRVAGPPDSRYTPSDEDEQRQQDQEAGFSPFGVPDEGPYLPTIVKGVDRPPWTNPALRGGPYYRPDSMPGLGTNGLAELPYHPPRYGGVSMGDGAYLPTVTKGVASPPWTRPVRGGGPFGDFANPNPPPPGSDPPAPIGGAGFGRDRRGRNEPYLPTILKGDEPPLTPGQQADADRQSGFGEWYDQPGGPPVEGVEGLPPSGGARVAANVPWSVLGFEGHDQGEAWANKFHQDYGYWPWEGAGTEEENLGRNLANHLYGPGEAPYPAEEEYPYEEYPYELPPEEEEPFMWGGGGGFFMPMYFGGGGGGGGYYRQPSRPWLYPQMARGI